MTVPMRPRGAVRSIAEGALGSLGRIDRGRPDLLGVLTYHRLAPVGSGHARGIVSATPEAFARQMTMLAKEYHPISLADLTARRRGGPALPRRSVLVTFDDAYHEFADVAWPILRDLGIPAVLFVPTAYPDEAVEFWWDRLNAALSGAPTRTVWHSPVGPLALTTTADRSAAYGQLRERIKALAHRDALALVDRVAADLGDAPGAMAGTPGVPPAVLGWDALRALADDGCDLAPHSRTHPLLTQVPANELDDEIAGSVGDLARQLDRPPSAAFAYPSGAASSTVRQAVERSGIEVAFTTERGMNDLRQCDWLAIRRINVGMRTDLALIRAQLGSRLGPLVTALAARGRTRTAGSERASTSVASGPG